MIVTTFLHDGNTKTIFNVSTKDLEYDILNASFLTEHKNITIF